MERFGGHGSAIAQVYNHIILPLASTQDKITQIRWGIADFEHRFGRKPEGMWLSETAVDLESLDLLARHGILFTILAPHQCARVRAIGKKKDSRIPPGTKPPMRVSTQRNPTWCTRRRDTASRYFFTMGRLRAPLHLKDC